MTHTPQLTPAQVRHLRPVHTRHPKQMLYEFCEFFPFAESRDKLWKLTMAFLSSKDADYLTHQERGNYLFFYQQLEALLEAVYLLNERQQRKQPWLVVQPEEPITRLEEPPTDENLKQQLYLLRAEVERLRNAANS